jgi:hypothetical protein
LSRAFERRATIVGPIRRGAKEASDHPRFCDLSVDQERAVPVRPLHLAARNPGTRAVYPSARCEKALKPAAKKPGAGRRRTRNVL